MLLGINTASRITEFALISRKKVVYEESWESNRDESEKLPKKLAEAFLNLGKDFRHIKKLLVVNGPGFFTALRIGIAISQAIGYVLRIPMYAINHFDIFRLKDIDLKTNFILLYGGKRELFVRKTKMPLNNRRIEIVTMEDFLKKHGRMQNKLFLGGEFPLEYFKTISNNSKVKFVPRDELLSFGKALTKLDFFALKPKKELKPFYMRTPEITISKSPLTLV